MRESVVLDALRASGPAPAPRPAPSRRVLRAGEVVTLDSRAIGEAEQREREQAQHDLDRRLAAAREQGRAEGVAATLADGTAAVLRAAEALDRIEARDAAQQEREVAAVSGATVALAVLVAEWVVRRELAEDAGRSLLGRLETGLTALLPSPTTRLSVSHADHALVAEWAERRGRVGTTVVADQRLQPGDAVVVTDAGRAEVTVAAALRAAAVALGVPDDGTDA